MHRAEATTERSRGSKRRGKTASGAIGPRSHENEVGASFLAGATGTTHGVCAGECQGGQGC